MSVKFHFLNVGDGDCTIIDFPERELKHNSDVKYPARIMMVDIHHHDDHVDYENVINYYRKNFKDKSGNLRPIFRFVSSHPHKDHIKGLNRLFEEIPIVNFWDIDHQFEPVKEGSDWESYKDDWERYATIRGNKPEGPTVLKYLDSSNSSQYWNEDRIAILAPSKKLNEYVHIKEDGTKRTTEEIGQLLNNLSYVLLIKVNDIKIVLAADAETESWNYILKNHSDKISNIDILKAPHHGRESAFHEEAVKIMNPQKIVISASEDCEHIVPEKYQKAAPNAIIYSTSEIGTFGFECEFNGVITLF